MSSSSARKRRRRRRRRHNQTRGFPLRCSPRLPRPNLRQLLHQHRQKRHVPHILISAHQHVISVFALCRCLLPKSSLRPLSLRNRKRMFMRRNFPLKDHLSQTVCLRPLWTSEERRLGRQPAQTPTFALSLKLGKDQSLIESPPLPLSGCVCRASAAAQYEALQVVSVQ